MNSTIKIALGSAAIVLAVPVEAQQRGGKCRVEVVELCGTDRSAMRSCLREKFSQLSETCQTRIRERMQQRRAQRGEEGRENRRQNEQAESD